MHVFCIYLRVGASLAAGRVPVAATWLHMIPSPLTTNRVSIIHDPVHVVEVCGAIIASKQEQLLTHYSTHMSISMDIAIKLYQIKTY